MAFDTLIFDLGGVLIDWNPRYVFREVFDHDEERMEWFFDNIATSDWNEEQDAGRDLWEATDRLVAEHPEWETQIRQYYGRWEEMLGGPIDGTVAILRELRDRNEHRLLALTNWSHQTFPVALERYDFLGWFEGILVSGEERTRKPFDKIYQLMLSRYDLEAGNCLFIDDNLRNVQAAQAFGIPSVRFESPEQLRRYLESSGVLPSVTAGS